VFDLANKNALDLSKCSTMVLDEADKLLSQDFQSIIEDIISFLPQKRQIMLFSATFPINVKGFKDKYLKYAVFKNLMDELTLLGLTQYYTYLQEKLKLHCIHTLFQKVTSLITIIYSYYLIVGNQSSNNILQYNQKSRVISQKNNRYGLFMLLYPCQNESIR